MPGQSGEARLVAILLMSLLAGIGVVLVDQLDRAFTNDRVPTEQLEGRIAQYTLTVGGDLDGFVLAGGTQVHLPRHLARSLAVVARPGDPVTVQVRKLDASPLVEAVELRNELSGVTLTSNGPQPGHGREPMQIGGKVQFALHGPAGEVNGAVLEDGTVLRLPPENTQLFAAQLVPGRVVVAQGLIVTTAMGRVVEVNRLD